MQLVHLAVTCTVLSGSGPGDTSSAFGQEGFLQLQPTFPGLVDMDSFGGRI